MFLSQLNKRLSAIFFWICVVNNHTFSIWKRFLADLTQKKILCILIKINIHLQAYSMYLYSSVRMNQVNVYFYSLLSVYETVNTYCMFSSSKIHFFISVVYNLFPFQLTLQLSKKKKSNLSIGLCFEMAINILELIQKRYQIFQVSWSNE